MKKQASDGSYKSFVVRVWQDELTGETRATLKDAATGQQQHFASLSLLMASLLGAVSSAGCSESQTQPVERSL